MGCKICILFLERMAVVELNVDHVDHEDHAELLT